MKEFMESHKWAIVLSVAAIIIVLLFYLIGWWTLLAVLLIGVAIFFGKLLDNGGPGAVKDFFRNLFKGKNA